MFLWEIQWEALWERIEILNGTRHRSIHSGTWIYKLNDQTFYGTERGLRSADTFMQQNESSNNEETTTPSQKSITAGSSTSMRRTQTNSTATASASTSSSSASDGKQALNDDGNLPDENKTKTTIKKEILHRTAIPESQNQQNRNIIKNDDLGQLISSKINTVLLDDDILDVWGKKQEIANKKGREKNSKKNNQKKNYKKKKKKKKISQETTTQENE